MASDEIKRGTRLVRKSDLMWESDGWTAKVMATANGWAMVRYPHCIPFTVYLKDIGPEKEWEVYDSK